MDEDETWECPPEQVILAESPTEDAPPKELVVRANACSASTVTGPKDMPSAWAVCDSGATHVLLPLREKPKDREDFRPVRLRLAAGRVQIASILERETLQQE